jgi:pimeloyl-ACP methyl ester carboxylesterase
MIDSSRRTVLANGAAAAAASAVPQVFAQAQPAGAVPGLPAGAKVGFYEKGNVRIRYAEIGSGFPLLATPGGGLNSCIAVWARAVINIPEEFKNDFRVITMDQRNATGGESTGPVPVDDPWGAFADDQLGVMDHLGINKFFFFGNCIGGPFAMKLMEQAPQRVAAAILSQPVGYNPANPDYMYDAGKTVWAKELRERRPDVSMETIEKYLHNLYRVRPDFVYSVSREFAKSCQTSMLVLPDDVVSHPLVASIDVASLCPNCRDHGVPLEGAAGAEGAHHQPRAHLPAAASYGVAKSESPGLLRYPFDIGDEPRSARASDGGRRSATGSTRRRAMRHQAMPWTPAAQLTSPASCAA